MTTPAALRFLDGGGHMGAFMRAHDWSTSSLGAPHTWPQTLRTVVRIMLNTGHPMYVFWGPDLACLYNDAYSESIGPERHPGSLGRPGREVWDEIWSIIGPQIEQVMAGKGATWHENALVPITRFGRREDVYWTYSYSPIDDHTAPAGVGGVLVLCTETTAQVMAARTLASERDRLARLFEQAPTFMAMLQGPEHRFVLANPSFSHLVGYRPVLGKTVADALPDAAAQGYVELLDQVFRSGEPYIAFGAKYAMHLTPGEDAVERYVDFVYQPITDDSATITGIFVLGADVTDRALAERAVHVRETQLREADRRKDEFLAILAHELRNPLAPIRTGLELMRLAGNTPGAVERIRGVMDRQVAHMVRLIDDLLDVSRIATGKIQLQRVPTLLSTVIDNAVDANREAMQKKHLNLSIEAPDAACVLDVDPIRAVQVLSNLVNNAAKFTDPHGHIHIVARHDDGRVVIAVRDSGRGISPELLPRIFDLFVQGRESSQPGLGIGLALARQLTEMHGGTISAHSAGLGHGSTFELVLPLSAAGAPDRPPRQASGSVDARRVLVIDDNEDAANVTAQLVEALGG